MLWVSLPLNIGNVFYVIFSMQRYLAKFFFFLKGIFNLHLFIGYGEENKYYSHPFNKKWLELFIGKHNNFKNWIIFYNILLETSQHKIVIII